MITQPTAQLVQWQDFKVKSEVDAVMEMAQSRGWKDCEIFGYGDMITQPLDSKGWKLIPADLYQYSIPAAGVARVLEIIQAGVQIKGIVIADDERSAAKPARSTGLNISLPTAEAIISFIGKAAALVGKLLATLLVIALPIAIVLAIAVFPMGFIKTAGVITLTILLFGSIGYDPKLIILVDDGAGNTVWISVLTWYE